MIFKFIRSNFAFILVFFGTLLFCSFAFAQDAAEEEMKLGGYGVSVILTVVMGLIYKFVPAIPDQFKALITIAIGLLLSIAAMFYAPPEVITFKTWIDYVVSGIFLGCGAIGVYEGARTLFKPRK